MPICQFKSLVFLVIGFGLLGARDRSIYISKGNFWKWRTWGLNSSRSGLIIVRVGKRRRNIFEIHNIDFFVGREFNIHDDSLPITNSIINEFVYIFSIVIFEWNTVKPHIISKLTLEDFLDLFLYCLDVGVWGNLPAAKSVRRPSGLNKTSRRVWGLIRYRSWGRRCRISSCRWRIACWEIPCFFIGQYFWGFGNGMNSCYENKIFFSKSEHKPVFWISVPINAFFHRFDARLWISLKFVFVLVGYEV